MSVVNHLTRLANVRGRTIVVAAALMAPLAASAAVAAPALAKGPTGDFAVFAQCPRFTSGVTLCVHSQNQNRRSDAGQTDGAGQQDDHAAGWDHP